MLHVNHSSIKRKKNKRRASSELQRTRTDASRKETYKRPISPWKNEVLQHHCSLDKRKWKPPGVSTFAHRINNTHVLCTWGAGPHTLLGGCSRLEKSLAISYTVKHTPALGPGGSAPGYGLEGMEAYVPTYTCTRRQLYLWEPNRGNHPEGQQQEKA